MVGTRRTNACATCRRRRVKCDEVRPVCGQCAKKSRSCRESLPPDFVWIKSGQHRISMPAVHSEVDGSIFVAKASTSQTRLSLVRTSKAAGGGVFHKYRIGSDKQHEKATVPSSPELAPIDRLRLSVVAAFEDARVGLRLLDMTPLWCIFPRHIGRSSVMDDALRCLVLTHRTFVLSISRGNLDGDNLHTQSYHKALKGLQEALGDRKSGAVSTTLAAIILLSAVESLGRSGANFNYLRHSGGVAAYVRAAGIECTRDELGEAMLIGAVGPIIVDSFMSQTSCLLSEPSWSWVMEHMHQKHQHPKNIMLRIAQIMSDMSVVLTDFRKARNSDKLIEPLQAVFRDAIMVRDAAYQSRKDLDTVMRHWDAPDQCLASSRPATTEGSPFELVNWFPDSDTAGKNMYSWGTLIQINGILCNIHDCLHSRNAAIWSYNEKEQSYLDGVSFSQCILESLEYAGSKAPLGAGYLPYPMLMALNHVPEEWTGWAFKTVNDIYGPMTSPFRQRGILDACNAVLLGRSGEDIDLFELGEEN